MEMNICYFIIQSLSHGFKLVVQLKCPMICVLCCGKKRQLFNPPNYSTAPSCIPYHTCIILTFFQLH